MRGFRECGSVCRSISFDPERLLDVDDERVLVFVRFSFGGQTAVSAVETASRRSSRFATGLIVRVKVYRYALRSPQLRGLRSSCPRTWTSCVAVCGLGNVAIVARSIGLTPRS